MRALRATAVSSLATLPDQFESSAGKEAASVEPLERFFAREFSVGGDLLRVVRKDLQDLVAVCDGKMKQTNHLRTLIAAVNKGMCFQVHASPITDHCQQARSRNTGGDIGFTRASLCRNGFPTLLAAWLSSRPGRAGSRSSSASCSFQVSSRCKAMAIHVAKPSSPRCRWLPHGDQANGCAPYTDVA